MESPSAPAHRGALPWRRLLLTASLFTFWSPPTTAQVTVELEPPIAAEGEEVLLLAHKLPETFLRLDWYKGTTEYTNLIVALRKNPENIINGPAHSGRETLYSNGSLLIRNLTVGDTGNYWIQVTTMSGDFNYGKGELRVYEPLSKPNITANNSRPLEQESVVLTCEPLSPHTTYRWFNNTQSVEPSARLQLSMDNRTLTVLHVIRQDTGSYECETSNPVSVHRSDPVNLTVLYGPDPLIIYPSKRNYHRGENLNLFCLTASYPPAQFSWFMEKKPLGSTQNLSIPNLSLNDSGSYSCLASNSFTHINRTIVINITVSEPVATRLSKSPIPIPVQTMIDGAGPVVLTCITNDTEVSTRWYLNDKNLQPTERRKVSADNRTLTLQLVMMDDDGDFECEVFNHISSCRSGCIRLQVTHKWPESVVPPSIQFTHSTVTEGAGPVVLTCLTNDTGVSIQWYLNDKGLQPAERRKLSTDNRTLTLQPVLMADGGDYQCEVSNSISSNRSDRVRLQVTSGRGAVPVGIIVGTVFGVLVGVGLVAALGYFLFRRRAKRNQGHNDHVEMKPPTNSPGPGAPSSSAAQTPLPDQSPADHIYEYLLPDQSPAEDIYEYLLPDQSPADHVYEYLLPDQSPADHVYEYLLPDQSPADHVYEYLLPDQSPADHVYEYLLPDQSPAEDIYEYLLPDQSPADHVYEYLLPDQSPADHVYEILLNPDSSL